MLYELLAIFVGGGIGAMLRYLITLLAGKTVGASHWGTFTVNVIGCLAIGYILGLMIDRANAFSPHLKLFLTVGFLGGLTTFSTFNYEVFSFIKEGRFLHGTGYMLLSCFGGLFFTTLGFYLANLQKI